MIKASAAPVLLAIVLPLNVESNRRYATTESRGLNLPGLESPGYRQAPLRGKSCVNELCVKGSRSHRTRDVLYSTDSW
jgi:hypothetical protein